jgi:pSer/pThr/pTyr-binding forkhead associated (FHA) protein
VTDEDPTPPRCRLKAEASGATCEVRVGETIRLGRAPDNDLVCDDPSVSRYHARAMWGEDVALPVVRNNVTPDALRLDGVRVFDMAPLRDGARLKLGTVELLVELLDLGGGKEQSELIAEFSEPETVEKVTSRLKALMVPRTLPDYELALPRREECLAALARVMSAADAEAVWSEACTEAGINPEAIDEVETLEQVVQVLRSKAGLVQIVALSLSIRIDTYRCLRAKAGK